MSSNALPAWVQGHHDNTWAHGPLPRCVDVVSSSNGKEPCYTLDIGRGKDSISMRSLHHPLSPKGKAEWDKVLPNVPQHHGKTEFIGISHPNIVYRPHEWVWDGSDTDPRRSLLKALQFSDVQIAIQDFEKEEVKAAVSQIMGATKEELYHPRDRADYAVYPEEHRISAWARYFKRSLVIVAPEVDAKRPAWGAYNNKLATQRSEVRPRYSTGEQDQYRPIFLGCLSKNGDKNATKWFALTPSPAFQKRFRDQWQVPNWGSLAPKFNYTDTEKFVFAAVSLHRSILLRSIIPAVSNDDLAECIVQYGNFLNKGHGSGIFRYSRPKKPTVDRIDFFTLGRWILCSPEGSSAKQHAKAWDIVIEKYFAFRKNLSKSSWEEYMKAGAAAQLKK
ncbi:hypothetical protein DE146DRAFT_633876 [Phaeosphaeria sp. MPI-PUGE-AT-0046c]|nr:hypothetical protein DE146DRAFT_633876 [Phaeosphaeria sp. MPI-PUGE-AT-0046c]